MENGSVVEQCLVKIIVWILPIEVLDSGILWAPFRYWSIHAVFRSSVGLFLVYIQQ